MNTKFRNINDSLLDQETIHREIFKAIVQNDEKKDFTFGLKID